MRVRIKSRKNSTVQRLVSFLMAHRYSKIFKRLEEIEGSYRVSGRDCSILSRAVFLARVFSPSSFGHGSRIPLDPQTDRAHQHGRQYTSRRCPADRRTYLYFSVSTQGLGENSASRGPIVSYNPFRNSSSTIAASETGNKMKNVQFGLPARWGFGWVLALTSRIRLASLGWWARACPIWSWSDGRWLGTKFGVECGILQNPLPTESTVQLPRHRRPAWKGQAGNRRRQTRSAISHIMDFLRTYYLLKWRRINVFCVLISPVLVETEG